MSDKVVSLRGGPVWSGEPNPALIEFLETVLEQARVGEIAGAVIVRQWRDDAADFQSAGYLTTYRIVGAIEAAKIKLLSDGDA